MGSPFLAAVLYNEKIGSTMVVLCAGYGYVFFEGAGRLLRDGRRRVNTKTLFLLSVATACGLRLMCFLGFWFVRGDAFLTVESEVSSELEFYARAVIVLFDLPDFMLASTYVLLLVVWAECFLGSRRHWLSARTFKRTWHHAYLGFNVVLYGAQLLIYCVVFLSDTVDGVALLYVVPAILTFAVPVVHLTLYVFLSLRFAGFPTVSRHAATRLGRVTRITSVWTLSRVAWSAVVSATVLGLWPPWKQAAKNHHDDDDLRGGGGERKSPPLHAPPRSPDAFEFSNVAIVGLFLFTEIVPFALTLDSVLLDDDDADDADDDISSSHSRHPHDVAVPPLNGRHYGASATTDVLFETDDDFFDNDLR